ncbi:MAG: M28 family peptidase [Candidatus Marinimicrobia bacterium]|nr:M28 family peptidase [Candidatus Neomarinimicrobiota bacterium]
MKLSVSAMLSFLFVLTLFSCGGNKPDFDGDSAFGYLVKQCDFGPRNPGSRGHNNTLNYLLTEMRTFADSVKVQKFSHFDNGTGISLDLTNIIASFNVSDANRVLLAAHWDTRPRSDQDQIPSKRNQPLLGANDGASGVAVLLELAKIFSENPPPIGVDLILFDGEDFGEEGDLDRYFLGSRHFAKNFTGQKPKWAIIIDMVGDAELELPIERYSFERNKKLVEKVWDAAERAGASQFKRRLGSYVQDDHLMLYEYAGIAAIDIIDFDYVRGGINLWHTSLDTPEMCSPASLAAVGRTLIELIYE